MKKHPILKMLLAFMFALILSICLAGPGSFGGSSSRSSFGGGGFSSGRSSSFGGGSFGRSSSSSSFGGGSYRSSSSSSFGRSSSSSSFGSGSSRYSPSKTYYSGSSSSSRIGSSNSGYNSSSRIQTPARTSTTYTPSRNYRIGARPTVHYSDTVFIGGRTCYVYPGGGYSYIAGGPIIGYYDAPVYYPSHGTSPVLIVLCVLGGIVLLVVVLSALGNR